MKEGIYKVSDRTDQRVYVVTADDKITLYPVVKTKVGWTANEDSAVSIPVLLVDPHAIKSITFTTQSFDVDVLTILFKFRPATSGFPNQLNTNFNAAGFFGHRWDSYSLTYARNPHNSYKGKINHYGYSIGLFGGIGATQMNQFVTNNQVSSEYDGVVITKGFAGLFAIGSLTFGAAAGLDHLMDKNNTVWIYQAKPWVGFTIGLNLN